MVRSAGTGTATAPAGGADWSGPAGAVASRQQRGGPMPDLTRRAFLSGSSAAAGGLAPPAWARRLHRLGRQATTTARPPTAAPATAPPFDPADWASVRDQFPVDRPTSPSSPPGCWPPTPVRWPTPSSATGPGLDEHTHAYLAATEVDAETAVRGRRGRVPGRRSPARSALTDSTTMGLGLLYGGLRLRPDQQVLTTEHDFYSTHQALDLRSARDGVTVDRVRPLRRSGRGHRRRRGRPADGGRHPGRPASWRSRGCTRARA